MADDEATIYPWRPRTPQEEGIYQEKRILKKRGARRHPASGAGHIKNDGSTSEELIEIKNAAKTHTVNVDDIKALYQRGVRQRLQPVYVIRFDNGLIVEGRVGMDVKGDDGDPYPS